MSRSYRREAVLVLPLAVFGVSFGSFAGTPYPSLPDSTLARVQGANPNSLVLYAVVCSCVQPDGICSSWCDEEHVEMKCTFCTTGGSGYVTSPSGSGSPQKPTTTTDCTTGNIGYAVCSPIYNPQGPTTYTCENFTGYTSSNCQGSITDYTSQ